MRVTIETFKLAIITYTTSYSRSNKKGYSMIFLKAKKLSKKTFRILFSLKNAFNLRLARYYRLVLLVSNLSESSASHCTSINHYNIKNWIANNK